MPMGGLEILIVLIIILLFFGAKRIPELARSLGTSARELKKAAKEDAGESETKDADEAKTMVVPEDVSPEQDGNPVERGART